MSQPVSFKNRQKKRKKDSLHRTLIQKKMKQKSDSFKTRQKKRKKES